MHLPKVISSFILCGLLVIGFLFTGVHPAKAVEPSLQQIFDGYFGVGVIDTTQETEQETFPSGKYEVTLITKQTAASFAPNGWYPLSNLSQLNQIFPGDVPIPSTTQLDIPEEFGLWISTVELWRSQPALNSDGADHFSVFNIPSGGFAIGIEDVPGGGDKDFQDHVLAFAITQPAKTPLILIPGIGGSELKTSEETFWVDQDDGHGGKFNHAYSKDEKVWVNEDEATNPGEDDYFDVLRMKTDGVSSEANLGLTGNLYARFYQQEIDFFLNNDYRLNQDLFIFPYDWRKDIAETTTLLNTKIQEIKQITGADKVDLITHSMGGLIARSYISNSNQANNVRKLFTLGAPHLGSTEYLKTIDYGSCLFLKLGPLCLTIAPTEVKDVSQNLISGYQLSPSQVYFSLYSGEDNLHPLPFRDDRDVDNNGVTGPLNYNQIKSLLTNLGHNTSLFTPAELFHNLDINLPNTNGVEVYNIVGSGQPTLGQIIESYNINFAGIKLPKLDKIDINGDGTVPLFSASLTDPQKNLSYGGNSKIYYTNQEHKNLVTSGPALSLVKNILEGSSQLPDGVSTQPYSFSGTTLSVHSPVNIHAYDSDGNHTGPTPNGDFETNIPGSSYDTLDDAKFIWLPNTGQYTIKLEATDQGSFDFKIRKFENDVNTETFFYKEVPLTDTIKLETVLDTQSSESPILQLDEDGDGTIDETVNHFSILTGDANYDYTSPVISFDVNPKTIWPPNDKMVDVTITGTISDENPYITTILVDDEYNLVEPSTTIHNQTEINQTIKLQAARRGGDKDGRKYTIKVIGTDLAGNSSLAAVEVVVSHDQGKKNN